jgi:amino acid adenylation domain-containing protein
MYLINDISALLSRPIDACSYKQVEDPFTRTLVVNENLYCSLKEFCELHGITVNVVVQFLWHKLLQVYSNESQTIVGTTITGQDWVVEGIEEGSRLYTYNVPLLINWEEETTILSQLQRIQEQLTALNEESFANLEKLRKERQRVFHSLLVFENDPNPTPESGTVYEICDDTGKINCPLQIVAYEHKKALVVNLQYDRIYLEEENAERHLSTLKRILEQVLNNFTAPHQSISVLSADEYDQVVNQWNATDNEYAQDLTVQELFELQAEKTPDKTALIFADGAITYRQLNAKSNQLARNIRTRYEELTGRDLSPDVLIPLYSDRSVEMVIGILSILKAGGTYVAIDPNYPQERIDYILEDTAAELVLSRKHLIETGDKQFPPDKILLVDLSEDFYRTTDISNLRCINTTAHQVYVIYTSGSTGKPKGVFGSQLGLLNRLFWGWKTYPGVIDDVFSLKTNIGFADHVVELFSPLLTGLSLRIINDNEILDVKKMISILNDEKISRITLVPSYLSTLIQASTESPLELTHLKYVFCSGEYLPFHLACEFIKQFRNTLLVNIYGSTEVSADVTFYTVDRSYIERNPIHSLASADTRIYNIPIGKPIDNTKAYVLNSNGVPVPIGVVGELYISGVALSKGYLKNDHLTAARFISNSLATPADLARGYTRLFRTGDLVRWLEDGNLEFIGRNDDQVKIRGYRIELGEIEHTLSKIAGIKQACVLARERNTDGGSSKYLVGYYILGQGVEDVTTARILRHLAGILPDYMVPSALVCMNSFPLNVNGKLDKRALPDPDFSIESQHVAPRTELEKRMTAIWQEVLGLQQVGITDDFFRIGGNSILAIRVSHKMTTMLGFTVNVADIFSSRTIDSISQQKENAEANIPNIEKEF